ncbi:transketolase [Verrucomicrobiota bacterium]
MDKRAVEQRREILRVLERSRRGHIGSTFSLLEIIRVLYDDILHFDPARPDWNDRDRFILSKGHGCLALYLVLAEKGFFPQEELYKFCGFEAMLGGHPEQGKTPGVEASTGALGHGLSIGIGCALAARIDGKSYRTFVLTGDGECDEGSVWEAAMSAGKHKLSSLTVLIDYNKMQSYGRIEEVQDLEPFADKWQSFGFCVKEADGHDVDALRKALSTVPFHKDRPGVLICHTVKGKGIPSIENNASWHHKSRLTEEELAMLVQELKDIR